MTPFVTHEYRLLVWPAFQAPFEIVVQHDRFGATAVTEFRFSGKGAYVPRRSSRPLVRKVPPQRWAQFRKTVQDVKAWSIPDKQGYNSGSDGIFMILEMREGSRMRRIQRWEPFAFAESGFINLATEIVSVASR
jgi:hypothetical protein